MEHTYAVVMAGGVGSRFWPESRARAPKQLLDLTGEGRTMIAATVARLAPDISPERVIVVTGEITAKECARALPGVPAANILAEPVGRNTAPCIGWAALHALRRDPEAVLAVMPSDHLIADEAAFRSRVRIAVAAARKGALVTFGVTPDRPETGFGYIEAGDEASPGVRAVSRFVEKPDLPTAERYLASGRFLWNSGMFFFGARRILDEIRASMPSLAAGLDAIAKVAGTAQEAEVVSRLYPTLEAVSVDYGVMEKAHGILVVPVSFGWSDLGSWGAAYDRSQKDEAGNALQAGAVVVGSEGCLARAPAGKLVALVGVRDLVVVDTGDALLVCRRERSQDVKAVVDALKARGRGDLL
ncbi:MAG: mannose-1-phosphate guanylyltransferase [Deltaproteobacteria bacterium]|nr:mannose-1-phosphate guanylyltransferase [Deltaproteobacteria bacterium]